MRRILAIAILALAIVTSVGALRFVAASPVSNDGPQLGISP